MRLISKQTYKIISWILSNPKFTQTQVFKATGVSWGRMNAVVHWLLKRDFVRKREKYELIAPVQLLNLLANEIDLEKLPFELEIHREKIVSWLKRKRAVFCAASALGFYSSYFRDQSINVYYAPEFEEEFRNARRGLTKLYLYKSNLGLEKQDIKQKEGFRITSEMRTIIDMFADKRAYAVEPLLKKIVK